MIVEWICFTTAFTGQSINIRFIGTFENAINVIGFALFLEPVHDSMHFIIRYECAVDAHWQAKRTRGGVLAVAQGEGSRPLEMPRPSALGVVLAFFSFVGGFALVWHIWWLALVGLAGVVAAGLARAWQVEHEFEVDPSEIAAFEARGARA